MKISYISIKRAREEAVSRYEQYKGLALQKYGEVQDLVFDIKQFLKERQEAKKEFLRQQKLDRDLSLILGSGEHFFSAGLASEYTPLEEMPDWEDLRNDSRFDWTDFWHPTRMKTLKTANWSDGTTRAMSIRQEFGEDPEIPPKHGPTYGPVMVQEINKRNKELNKVPTLLSDEELKGLSIDEILQKVHEKFQESAAKTGARAFVMVDNREFLPKEVREEVEALEERIRDFHKREEEDGLSEN